MKNTIHHMFALLCLPAISLGTAACIDTEADPDLGFEGLEEEGSLGELESALGEAGCAYVPSDAIAPYPVPGSLSVRTSIDTSYDHEAPCPHQFVVEYPGGTGEVVVGSGWGDARPATPSRCANSHFTVGAYAFHPFNGWSLQGLILMSGVWDPVPGYCDFPLDLEHDSVAMKGGAKYRLAVQAYEDVCAFGLCAKVKRRAQASLIRVGLP